jgi:hypothetical protein
MKIECLVAITLAVLIITSFGSSGGLRDMTSSENISTLDGGSEKVRYSVVNNQSVNTYDFVTNTFYYLDDAYVTATLSKHNIFWSWEIIAVMMILLKTKNKSLLFPIKNRCMRWMVAA